MYRKNEGLGRFCAETGNFYATLQISANGRAADFHNRRGFWGAG